MSLDKLAKEIQNIANNLNDGKAAKQFMKKEAVKLKNLTVRTAKRKVKKLTGNYINGIKAGKPYIFQGAYSSRVYAAGKSNHAHLIEYGHRVVTKTGVDTGKITKGYNVFSQSKKEFEKEFKEDSEKFIDDIFKEIK